MSPISTAIWLCWAIEHPHMQWCTKKGKKSWTQGAMTMTKVLFSFMYKEVNYRILCRCTVTFLFSIFPSVVGRRVLDVDGVLVNHGNDSQKRWLHKETHVCSPLFKCPA